MLYRYEFPALQGPDGFLPGVRSLHAVSTQMEGFDHVLVCAGKWLRVFHHYIGEVDYQILNLSEMIDCVDEHIALLQQEVLLPLRTLHLIRLSLEHIAKSLAKCSVEIATLHGNFNSRNILVTRDGAIAAVDTSLHRRGPVYLDLAQLLIDLLSRKGAILTYGLFSRPAHWKAAIVRGYFETKSYDAGILNFYCALTTIEKWIECEKKWKRLFRGASFFQTYVERYFLRMLRNFF